MTKSIIIDRAVDIEMRDNVLLKADIYRPDDNQGYPAILTLSPHQ